MLMKYLLKIFSLAILVSLFSCKDDDANSSAEKLKTEMLTAESWGHPQVTHTDGDLSDQYTNFAIVFTSNGSAGFNGTYFVSNGGNAFTETTGLWMFNDDLTKIIFDSGKEIDFTLEDDFLQFDFVVNDPSGKVAGLSGHFIFELQPL